MMSFIDSANAPTVAAGLKLTDPSSKTKDELAQYAKAQWALRLDPSSHNRPREAAAATDNLYGFASPLSSEPFWNIRPEAMPSGPERAAIKDLGRLIPIACSSAEREIEVDFQAAPSRRPQ